MPDHCCGRHCALLLLLLISLPLLTWLLLLLAR
jgi:hypothetical protein